MSDMSGCLSLAPIELIGAAWRSSLAVGRCSPYQGLCTPLFLLVWTATAGILGPQTFWGHSLGLRSNSNRSDIGAKRSHQFSPVQASLCPRQSLLHQHVSDLAAYFIQLLSDFNRVPSFGGLWWGQGSQ